MWYTTTYICTSSYPNITKFFDDFLKHIQKIYSHKKIDLDFLLEALSPEEAYGKYYGGGLLYSRKFYKDKNYLELKVRSKWSRPYSLEYLLKCNFPTLKVFYLAENIEKNIFETNDTVGRYFPYKYRVTTLDKIHYMKTQYEYYNFLDTCKQIIVNRKQIDISYKEE